LFALALFKGKFRHSASILFYWFILVHID